MQLTSEPLTDVAELLPRSQNKSSGGDVGPQRLGAPDSLLKRAL
jgi:hypothetical protein